MTLVHLIYIHGFQGNDTSFQSFPLHLQERISSKVPGHLKVQSSLYPTYKSVKPLSYATKNFLEWLSTQPPGPVILVGHSMGGLLAAEAATDSSNNSSTAKPNRIVGVIAFDTPYLGMHPHVVVSGIASLLPKGDEKKDQSEKEMNDHPQVHIVDERVTGDWDEFKKKEHIERRPLSNALQESSRHPASLAPTTSNSTVSRQPSFSLSLISSRSPPPFIDRALSFISSHSEDPLVRWLRKHSQDPVSAGKRWIVERFQFGGSMFDPPGLKSRYTRLVEWQGGQWVNYWTQTVPRPPVEAVETKEIKAGEHAEQLDNDVALLETGISEGKTDTDPTPVALLETGIAEVKVEADPSSFAPVEATTASELPMNPDSLTLVNSSEAVDQSLPVVPSDDGEANDKEKEKQRKLQEKETAKTLKNLKKEQQKESKKTKSKTPRHFIVLPTGLGQVLGGAERWEKVLIAGVDDEVAAHCGLFIPTQNLDYEGLVDRVCEKILGWCDHL